MGDQGEPFLVYGTASNTTPTTQLLDWVSDGPVYDFCGKTRLYSGGTYVTKFPAPDFTAKATVCVTAKTEGAVDGLFLAGDREVRFGFRLNAKKDRFDVLVKDDESVTQLGRIAATQIDAGAHPAWTTGPVELEARVKPAASNPRQCEVVFACGEIVSKPVTLSNSIWQGVKIGLAAENRQSFRSLFSKAGEKSECNWIDCASFEWVK